MKYDHLDFTMRLVQVTANLQDALRQAHRLGVLAELGDSFSVEYAIKQIERDVKKASEALAIIKKGE